MGYTECDISMESKKGNSSPVPGCSISNGRGQSMKSSPFCPRSSSRMTQSIIRDHMVSHYKKVYSAKAAIDVSVPKSLIHSVKYNDQIRCDQLKRGGRPHSAFSLSQRNGRASCSSTQGRRSVQGDESPYLYSGSSMISTARVNTSFHVKQIVYRPCSIADSWRNSNTIRPTSELKYSSPDGSPHRQQAACTSATSGAQSGYKTFQDPVQKTYSGDLLQKHSRYFTQDKPFTPRTLKSDKHSYLSKYRYYTAPRRKTNQDCSNLGLMRQETYHGSTQTKEYSTEFDDPPQGFSTEREWSEDESIGPNILVSRQPIQINKSRSSDFLHSCRVSPEGMKSPIMKSVSAEEEELMYLEFIAEVTNDILSRGLFSDRVLERVLKRHIDMNKHRLDEDKMRHLLEVLRKDFESPVNSPTCSAEIEIKENDLHYKQRPMETKQENDLFPYASLITDNESPGTADPLAVSIPLHCGSCERTSPTETSKEGLEDLDQLTGTGPLWLSEGVSDYTEINEEDLPQTPKETHGYTTMASDDGLHHKPAEYNYDGMSKELEDLGISLSESLHVSSNTHGNTEGASDEQHLNTFISDDEL
ncbi:spermatogenesis-associated protein 7 [Lampris incognitus]|uniref:spermatogenesis-associated protein 7 n=1 Tax=Lampris incognitus TaxID=2546036 RepID=UPI0024B4DBF1|nr:spermatogenesis-associated protein 7 [Lampris incognitus]